MATITYPPSAVATKLPIGASAERDAIASMMGNSVLRVLLAKDKTNVPENDAEARDPSTGLNFVLGVPPQDVPMPVVAVMFGERTPQYAAAGGGPSGGKTTKGQGTLISLRHSIQIVVNSRLYQEAADIGALILQVLEQAETPHVRRWQVTGYDLQAVKLSESSMIHGYEVTIGFLCDMRGTEST